ncbi:MerR family transcriptional regulator [Paenibacillus ihumii]|uniref:MerR family transcriptional regulator n=1 Tax=Paenibacillus ihumii TaxID=687436 RepID=UPI0006D86085|nr:MerR family transcriptional regulator [Paenibacillus ihumii]
MIRIGELAKKANISKRTLYHYEQIGLLQPTLIAGNRYRYYDENALFHLQKILLLKSIGYTLEQIKDFFQNQIQNQSQSQNQTKESESESWIVSLNEQIELIQRKKDELSRMEYYLRSTVHAIQIKGTVQAQEVLQVIQALDGRPLVDGVIPAEFGDDFPLTPEEKDIMSRLPVLGSDDQRMDEILAIYQQVKEVMHQPPHSPEAQEIASRLYHKSLELFEGNGQLLDKYWELIRPSQDEEPVVMGMDAELMSYMDQMIISFLNQRGEGDHEQA